MPYPLGETGEIIFECDHEIEFELANDTHFRSMMGLMFNFARYRVSYPKIHSSNSVPFCDWVVNSRVGNLNK